MKRFAFILAAAFGLCLSGGARAEIGTWTYGGYQPPWNPLRYCNEKCKTCEEKRLEHFWHDYYDAMKRYYAGLEHIDWVTYYKNHGYQINSGCGNGCGGPYGGGGYGQYGPYGQGGNCPVIQYAPVFATPSLQWAVPNNCLGGPPVGPGCFGPGGYPGN